MADDNTPTSDQPEADRGQEQEKDRDRTDTCSDNPGPQWLKDLLDKLRGGNDGNGEDEYERFRVRSLPQEEKDRGRDR